MRKDKILPIIALMMTLPVIAASYAFGRLKLGSTHVVPVDAFPRQIGMWRMIEERPESAVTRKIIPNAIMTDRTYALPSGDAVQLLLLTGSTPSSFHKPKVCFPAQGWSLSDIIITHVDGYQCSEFDATLGNQKTRVIYWWVGDFRSDLPHNAINTVMYKLHKMVQPEQNNSLFVRIMIPEDSCTLGKGMKFADDVMRHSLALSSSVLPVVAVRPNQ